MANRPNGRRVVAKATIGGKARYMRPKIGTAEVLGLEILNSIPKGKRDAVIRGAKGSKSYTVYFQVPQVVGGTTVKSVDLPVPAEVKLREMYSFLKGKQITAGMVSPDGISYFWRKTTLGFLDNLPTANDLVEGIGDALNNVLDSPYTQLLIEGIDLLI